MAILLTHPHEGRPPPLREIAGMVDYGRLVAIELVGGAVTNLVTLLAHDLRGGAELHSEPVK